MDGYLARKMNSDSKKGAYWDVVADFILIITCWGAMALQGWYPWLLVPLLGLIFALFLITSRFKELIYDPLGKYLGSFLMVIIILSLTFPQPMFRTYLLIIILFYIFLSFISRILFIISKKK